MSNIDRDELDKLLDAGLATYASEPRPGIENRILAGLASAEMPPRRRWLWWLAVAIPAAACFVVMIANRETPVVVVAPPGVVAQTPVVAESKLEMPKIEAPRPRMQRIARAVKRAQFPTAAPLTAEERALRDLAAFAPEALRVEPMAEIRIEPIQIEPLQTGGLSEELNR